MAAPWWLVSPVVSRTPSEMSDPHAPAARGSRKFAVSLFADLTGYTALCERLDPEDVERAVTPLMAALQDAVNAERGVVLNVAGDGVFAIFGVPDALPDGPTRAVHAAQQMRDAVTTLNDQIDAIALPDVHIGIAAGEVLLTSVAREGTWSVIGSSVNLASRLCDAAKAGEVLVDDSCRRLVRKDYEWDEPQRLSLKGQDRETIAWPLRSARSELQPVGDVQVFVGREAQLAALDAELLSLAESGVSRTIVIRGGAGIGKSTLAEQWLTTHPELESWRIECDEVFGHDDLLSLHELISPNSTDTRSMPRVSPADRSDPYPLVVHALRASLETSVAGRPTALLVENLHASDTILGEFLLELSRDPLDAPLLVLATWRDEAQSRVEPALLGRTLHLAPLERAEAAALVQAALECELDPESLALVMSRTQGHPLMVRESALQLAEIRARSGTEQVDAVKILARSLPTSLRMFLAARIDRLTPADRAVVHDLSAVGTHFTTHWVGAVLGRRAEESLPGLARRGILTARGESWTFTHDLLREVAYSTLTRSHRADLHRRQLGLLKPDADPHDRANHALAWNEAVSPVDREQYSAATVAAVRETLRLSQHLYERQARAALEAVRRATSAARDCVRIEPGLSAQLWALEAQCLSEMGLDDDALRLAAQAEQTAAQAELDAPRLAPLMTRGFVLSTLRRFESARQALEEAAQIAERLGDLAAQAEAIRLLADTWRHSLISRYLALTEEAFRLFETAGDSRGAAECARTLAYETSVRAVNVFTKWRDIAGRLTDDGDLRSKAALAKADAIASGARLDHAACAAAGATLVEIGEALESPDLLAEGLLDVTEAQTHLGNPERACAAGLRLIELATTQGNRRMRATAAAAIARPMLRTGNLARSHEEIAIAREMAHEFGHGEAASVGSATAACLGDRGLWGDALRELRGSLDLYREGGFSLGVLCALPDDIRIAASVGSPWSNAAVQRVIEDAEALGAPLIASYLSALDAWAQPGPAVAAESAEPAQEACLEERAVRAETIALRQEREGANAEPAWRQARELWERLGYTIWLARAQARSGDLDGAQHTLDVLDSPAEARAWALGEVAAS